jgi:hypothetical protein
MRDREIRATGMGKTEVRLPTRVAGLSRLDFPRFDPWRGKIPFVSICACRTVGFGERMYSRSVLSVLICGWVRLLCVSVVNES